MRPRSEPPADWPRPPKRRGILVDWPCFHAEQLEEAPTRRAPGMSWAEWHEARYLATGDERELTRMMRHVSPANGRFPVLP